MKFLRDFFSTSNEINEDTVIGVVFVVTLLVATFITDVEPEKYYILAGLVAACFGLAALKK